MNKENDVFVKRRPTGVESGGVVHANEEGERSDPAKLALPVAAAGSRGT